jgi:hypothetical protein
MLPFVRKDSTTMLNLDVMKNFMGRTSKGAETVWDEVWIGRRALTRNGAQARSR